MIERIDTRSLKRTVDLVELAGRHTILRKTARGEYCGACPKCGGDDRFHVHVDGWYFCRQCHTERGDAIEFVGWCNGVDFKQAASALAAGTLPLVTDPRTPAKPRKQARDGLPSWAASRVATAQERLMGKGGELARQYLTRRGLLPETWREFGLGFDPAVAVPGTDGKKKAAAIVIPWYGMGGELVAVRYRFVHGREKTSMYGSGFAGNIFNIHAVYPSPLMTLIICEGELNALSCWQVAGHTRVDVVSMGSESATMPDALIEVAAHYGRVITWLDDPEKAARVAKAIPGAIALKSLDGKDANDRLVGGELGGLLCAARLNLCQSNTERLALLWDIYDGGLVAPGLDDRTAAHLRGLAAGLGQRVTLRKVGNAWLTGSGAE